MIQAVIFDMDGVVIDSEPVWFKKAHRFYLQLLGSWSKADEKKYATGKSVHDMYLSLKKDKRLKTTEKQFTQQMDQLAVTVYQEAPLLPDIKSVLKRLRSQKYQVGLASSSRPLWIQTTLARENIKQYFDTVYSIYHIKGKGKPAPDIYFHTAKKLKVKSQYCLVIEDTTHGIKAAKAAGMKCLALRTKSNPRQDLSLADAVITSLPQLLYHLN